MAILSSQIKTITPKDPLFPQSLKKIKKPPKRLYYLGRINFEKKPLLAIVGTRRCSDYGKKLCLDFTKELVRAGFVIVSGLARGIDAFSHKICLENKGETLAVLGSGLEKIYPRENLRLAEEIINSSGGIISEYPPKTPPNFYHFPERNRIIAGLAWGVLVIEAREKSGALITANWAFLEKKPVFAVPGSIYHETSRGCHLLIQKGARLVQSPKEILEFFNIRPKKENENFSALSKEEVLILKTLLDKTLHIDQIIQLTGLNSRKVISLLSKLELEGKVKNLGGNIFAKI